MPNEEKKVSNWEERFEKWWHRDDTSNGDGSITLTVWSKESTKSFIASVREEAYAEGFAKGVEAVENYVPAKIPLDDLSNKMTYSEIVAFNSCINKILSAINELLTDKS